MTKQFLAFFAIGQITLYSCQIPHDKEIICTSNFSKAKQLTSKAPVDTLSLDTALVLVNRSMSCDSIKKSVVDLKLRLLMTLGRFKDGAAFVDSLSENDFTYPYKKKLYHDNLIALEYQSHNDTNKQRLMFRQMVSYLNDYIRSTNLNNKEFEEATLELYTIKANYVDSATINREIDSLKTVYPDKAEFLTFLYR